MQSIRIHFITVHAKTYCIKARMKNIQCTISSKWNEMQRKLCFFFVLLFTSTQLQQIFMQNAFSNIKRSKNTEKKFNKSTKNVQHIVFRFTFFILRRFSSWLFLEWDEKFKAEMPSTAKNYTFFTKFSWKHVRKE